MALTKCDLVPASRRAAVKEEIGKLLAGTEMVGSVIVETSTVIGDGIDTLRAELFAAAQATSRRDTQSRLRLPVDRCFTLRGVGTVVTGTVLSGAVVVGDQVSDQAVGLAARVRSIHAQNQPAERGQAGQRCALDLAGDGVTKEAIVRGDMVLDPEPSCTDGTDRHATHVAAVGDIACWQPARLHHGAAEVGARLVPLGEDWVQLVLDKPLAAASATEFVLRDTSAQRAIGGGRSRFAGPGAAAPHTATLGPVGGDGIGQCRRRDRRAAKSAALLSRRRRVPARPRPAHRFRRRGGRDAADVARRDLFAVAATLGRAGAILTRWSSGVSRRQSRCGRRRARCASPRRRAAPPTRISSRRRLPKWGGRAPSPPLAVWCVCPITRRACPRRRMRCGSISARY